MNTRMNRRTFLWTTSAALTVPMLTFGSSLAFAARDELIVRIDADIGNLDPANRVGSIEDNIIIAVCQNLARFKPGSLEWEPDAAKTIKQVSETEIEFELNPGLMFHGDYGEMTAEDVKFSFERFNAPGDAGKKAAYADDWGALDHVEVTGKYTGKLLFKHPAPAIWVIGIPDGSGGILSKKAVTELGDKIATTLIGSGPYLIKEWKPNDHVTLEKNPNYKGTDSVHFQRIICKPIPEWKTALLAFQAKEVAHTEIEPTAIPQIKKDPDSVVIEMEGIDYEWIGINVEKPPFNDLKVRQAIRYGVDVDAIIAGAYSGTVQRAKTLLAPRLLGHWADAPVYQYDVDKAKALLGEAGKTSFDCTLTCLNDARTQATAQIVQANLAEVGVNVKINALDGGAYWGMGEGDKSKDLELTIIPYSSKFDPSFQTQWFLSEQVGVWNWQRWKSPEFDKLHKEAASITDPNKRAEKYIRMQQLLDESASCIWITHGVRDFAHAKWLKPAILPNGSNWQYRYFKEA
ncbi:MAG TPA: ABC transporter substrate-binding protein [Dongiaceae bacterium]|jgi:peptide/nickel transport system substrate-binding protein|nr:ABC transporter substrate-binding protein [Dongiaceae bacterium]